MAELAISKPYQAGEPYFEADADAQKAEIVTFINTTKINSDNLLSNTFDTTYLANDAVTGAKLVDNAVTESKLAANAVIADNIAGGAITTAKIADTAVTGLKVAHRSATSSSSGSFSSTATTSTQVTNLSTGPTITVARPIFGWLIIDAEAYLLKSNTAGGFDRNLRILVQNSSTGNTVADYLLGDDRSSLGVSTIAFYDPSPQVGSNGYKVFVTVGVGGTGQVDVANYKLHIWYT